MFYIYDIDGLTFKGPMEAVEQRRRVEKSPVVMPVKGGESQLTFGEGPGAQAVKAYQSMITRENRVEPLVHIYQIMSSPVSTISREISLVDAWQMLQQGKIRQLVVTTERRKVAGLLADRDVLRHIVVDKEKIELSRNLTVGEILKEETVTTDSMSDIRRVARIMALYHIDAMPVLENEQLVGIVTRGDILRGFAENPKLNLWA